ncbi:hypothetical protein BG004_001723 [Podila humilis]|nr:hypothetical protein BG004_001723 [Podila humilis]
MDNDAQSLDAIGVGVIDQDVLEQDIITKASKAMDAKENELDKKRLEKTRKSSNKIQLEIRKLEANKKKLERGSFALTNLQDRLQELKDDLTQVERDEHDISERIRLRKAGKPLFEKLVSTTSAQEDGESQREYLIRTGKITPFAAMSGLEKSKNQDEHGFTVGATSTSAIGSEGNAVAPMSHVTLRRPSWSLVGKSTATTVTPKKTKEPEFDYAQWGATPERFSKKKAQAQLKSMDLQDDDDDMAHDNESETKEEFVDDQDFVDSDDVDAKDDKDYTDLQEISEDDDFKPESDLLQDEDGPKKRKKNSNGGAAYKFLCEDDGDEMHYQKRLSEWARKRRHLRWRVNHPDASMETDLEEGWDNPEQSLDPSLEITKAHPSIPDAELEGGYRIPGDIYSNLFDYQKTCAQWLWELHCQGAGGIIGDEMGLGKTIQIISFLAGLMYSDKLDAPVIIVCPATLLKQWVKEFHRWWSPARVAILHSSGSGMSFGGAKEVDHDGDEAHVIDDSYTDEYDSSASGKRKKQKTPKKRFGGGRTRHAVRYDSKNDNRQERTVADSIVDRISAKGHVLVTTYAGLRIHSSRLLRKNWSYIVLDEGHKIRNPDADITLTCKQFRTPHRIILSGTPIQNNLNELWSLFDFVFPGRLGTLPVFQSQFAIPINLGGYANASNVQVQTAYKCAVVLRDLINPYLLRRMKADVATDMPKKSEQVLFCKLTPPQRAAYEDFLRSNEMTSIMNGKRHALFGIDVVRKICNHADILGREQHKNDPDYGDYTKSGKMVVVKALLQMWRKEKHRILLFSQTRTMLDILEKFIKSEGYVYRRMDGTTPIQHRMGLVDEFNARDDIYVFLLTTKVGGLGVNLTGADRVIIFDPDWNPSTDVQARERAWRLGQTRAVTIYRLMTSGTIEEKIYHRQIFKQFLTNKILKDPKQRRFFKSHDMADLFTLEGEDAVGTETGGIFEGSEVAMKKPKVLGPTSSMSSGSGTGRSKGKSRRGDDSLEDLVRIDGLRKIEKFTSPRESGTLPGGIEGEDEELDFQFGQKKKSLTTGDDESHASESSEVNILSSLFASSGVHSALKHDEIMDSAKQEYLIVEREATRVAERAMAALKESRKRRRRQDLDVPTWTGKSGTAGAPKMFLMQQQDQERQRQAAASGTRPRFGTANTFNPTVAAASTSSAPAASKFGNQTGGSSRAGFGNSGGAAEAASSSLLAGMLERRRLEQGNTGVKHNTSVSGSSSPSSSAPGSPQVSGAGAEGGNVLQAGTQESLITKIQDFMMDQGGRVRSMDLVQHFQHQLADVEQLLFKKMLKGIAVLEKDSDGKGWWKLKPEYY